MKVKSRSQREHEDLEIMENYLESLEEGDEEGVKSKQERYGLEFLAADRHDRYCELVAAAEQRQEETQKERQIVYVLLEWEDYLTDGFSYYAGEDGVQNTLFHIARKILAALKEKDGPKTGENEQEAIGLQD